MQPHDIQFHIPCPYHDFNCRRWPADTEMRRHGHHFLQIIHVLEGDFSVDTGNGWQRVPPGWAHLLPPGCYHALRTGGGHLQFGLNFQPVEDERGWVRRLCRRFPAPCQYPLELPARLSHLLESPPFLLDELTQLRLIGLCDEYCLSLLSRAEQSVDQERKARLLEILEGHCREALTVAEIGIEMKMSRAALQRFCASHFGCGIHNLHEKIRIGQAIRLLHQSSPPIGECARRCGYPDIYTFSRSFKRVTGRSPSAFRQTQSLPG